MTTIAIVYYSGYGHTVKQAEALRDGAASVAGATATLYRIDANGDLPPVRAIADSEARHGARAASRQVDDAARKFRRRDASSDRCRVVSEGWNQDLFTRTNPFKTAR